MSIRTKIQWCDSTVNPTMGCDGCELWGTTRRTCYARRAPYAFWWCYLGLRSDIRGPDALPGRTTAAARWSDLAGVRRMDRPWPGQFASPAYSCRT